LRRQPNAVHSATTSNPAFFQTDRNGGRTPRKTPLTATRSPVPKAAPPAAAAAGDEMIK
jgi:hypothetical protein